MSQITTNNQIKISVSSFSEIGHIRQVNPAIIGFVRYIDPMEPQNRWHEKDRANFAAKNLY